MGDPTGPIDRDEEDGDAINVPTTCTACDRDWPCPTVTAINEALGEE